MVYCIKEFESTGRYAPQFDLINEDGNKDLRRVDRGMLLPNGRRLVWTLSGGYPITEHSSPDLTTLPRLGRAASSHKALPDFFGGPDQVPYISAAFRNLVEQFDPGTHQFFPITLLQKSGAAYPDEYFLFNICKILEAVVVARTDYRIVENTGTVTQYIGGFSVGRPNVVVRENIANGHHIWRDVSFLDHIFISDEFFNEFESRKLKKLSFPFIFRCKSE